MDSGYAELPANLPRGEANRLKSWAWHGDSVSLSRLRERRGRIANVAKTLDLDLSDEELQAFAVEFLDEEAEEAEQLQALESGMVFGGYDFDQISEVLTTSSDSLKSSCDVLSLMSSMDDTLDEYVRPGRQII